MCAGEQPEDASERLVVPRRTSGGGERHGFGQGVGKFPLNASSESKPTVEGK